MTVDIELTNCCNARCSFCPRDAMPHQGVMTPRIFAKALARAVELRALARAIPLVDEPRVVFCGTGDPLLNRHHVEFVRSVTRAAFRATLSTNGALLDPHTARALLDAGLATVVVNASDLGDEYERIYRLPFSVTRDNVARLVEIAAGRCDLYIAVVDHAGDAERVRTVMRYWRDLGVTRFIRYDLINRAGSLAVEGMDFETMDERAEARALLAARGIDPVCAAPFVHLYVGFDGRYYLCSSDWQKEVPLGSVFDSSFAAIAAEKLERVRTRAPLCQRCAIDPVNRLASRLRAVASGRAGAESSDALIHELAATDRVARRIAFEIASSVRPARPVTRAPVAPAGPFQRQGFNRPAIIGRSR